MITDVRRKNSRSCTAPSVCLWGWNDCAAQAVSEGAGVRRPRIQLFTGEAVGIECSRQSPPVQDQASIGLSGNPQQGPAAMKLSVDELVAAIVEGRGIGNGDAYKPWIQITRNTSSPCSNLNIGATPYLKRLTHYLSRGEREFALYLWWLGAEDVREQYPLWPWPHLHPVVQVEPRADARKHPGMRDIAAGAGIPLRNYPGTSIAHVLTIDMVVTVPASMNQARLIGVSCKPKAVIDAGSAISREIERAELDRRYCSAASIPFRLAHPEQLSRKLLVGLHAVAPIEPRASLDELLCSRSYQSYVDHLQRTAYVKPAWVASKEAGARVGWSKEEEQRAFRIAIWCQHVDHDLSKGFVTTRPLISGGTALRKQGCREWFGEVA